MKQIILDSVCIERFRSFRKPTAIEFTRSSGLKFISGVNRVEPALGANGAGKSTIFDAICYALYGTSIKGLRASELKSYGAPSLAVLVVLLIDGETYWVQRTSPPERLTINDRPAKQEDVDRLVGLSCDRFLSSVVFGQAVPLFVDLAKPARGDLLDEVLKLEIWLQAASKATERHRQQEDKLAELRNVTARLEGRLVAQPDLGELKALEGAWDNERDERLGGLIDRYETIERELQQLQQQIAPVDKAPIAAARAQYEHQSEAVTKFREKEVELGVALRRIDEDLTFFHEHDICPTCGQDITKEFCDGHIATLIADQERYTAERMAVAANIADAAGIAADLEDAWQRAFQDVAAIERGQAVVAEQMRAKRGESEDLQRQAVRARNEKNPYTAQRKQAVAERRRINAELDQQREAEDQATHKLSIVNYWRQGFRRVREFCLDNVLRELTLETRNSLLALGLHEWHVNFMTAAPTQKGTMRFGVEVQIEPPEQQAGSFDVLSGGEGQRVRLAVSLGLAGLIQRWAGVQWNFEVFDEPTAWLSEQGVEDLLDCLSYRATARDKSVFICDHRALSHSGFAENYLVSKDADGSHWQRV